MHPSQFRRWFELLRSSLDSLRSEIKEAAEKQERAIRDTADTADQKWREVPGVVISAVEAANKDVPTYEKTQRDKEYRQNRRMLWAQIITAGATILAFGAAAYYAKVAKDQLVSMQNTFNEIQKQTPEIKKSADAAKTAAEAAQQQAGLTKDQLVGTQAAALNLELWLDESTRQAGAVLQNIGNNARARDIQLTWSVARVSLSTGQQIGKALTFTPRIDPIRGSGPTTSGWEKRTDLPWPLPSIPAQSENEGPTNWPGETGIKLFGTLSYDNGFGDRYNPEPFCKIWLPHWKVKIAERQYSEGGGLIRCDVLHATILNNLAELDKIKKAQQ